VSTQGGGIMSGIQYKMLGNTEYCLPEAPHQIPNVSVLPQ